MRIAVRTIEHGSQGTHCFGASWFIALVFAVYLLIDTGALAQQTVQIGPRAPAVEINEDAVYYYVPVRRKSDKLLPLFNPTKDSLESRIVDLNSLDRSRPLSHSIREPSASERDKTPNSRVVELPPIRRSSAESMATVINAIASEDRTPKATAYQEDSLAAEANSSPPVKTPEELELPTVAVTEILPDPSSSSVENAEAPVPAPPPELQPTPGERDQTKLAAIAPAAPQGQSEATPLPSISTDQMTVLFNSGDSTIEDSNEATLRSIAAQINAEERTRLQLRAYASAQNSSASAARRLSLSRALAVRSFLIESGVNSTRIDVRALGAKSESGPADRVDLVVIN